jgi:uncharacterized protein YqiB (DUF1249 family)
MSHSIAELRQTSPMWYFERNYFALIDILDTLDLSVQDSVEFELGGDLVTIVLAEQTRYTLVVNIEHQFCRLEYFVPPLRFDVRLYTDAKLAEVTSYQGVRHLRPKYPYPNQGMHHPDEKRQTNLMLFDWLCACSRLDFRKAIINTIKQRRVHT